MSGLSASGLPGDDLRRTLRAAGRKARRWTERRDALIRQALADGLPTREVGALAGLSHTAVRMIQARPDHPQGATDAQPRPE